MGIRHRRILPWFLILTTGIVLCVLVRLNNHRRHLIPDRLYQKYYTRVKANTAMVPQDPTLGMDEHLSTCWNDQVFATLHENDPKRRKKYERYFLAHAPMTDGISGYQESPSFFTLTSNNQDDNDPPHKGGVNVMFSDWTAKNHWGHVHWGFTALSLWNSTLTVTKNSQPTSCMVCKAPEPEKMRGGPKVVLPKGEYITFVGWMWGHYGHSTHDNLPWLAYLHEMGVRNSQVKWILLDSMYARDILATLDPTMNIVWVQKDDWVQIEEGGSVTTIHHMKHRNDDPRFMDFLRHWSSRARDRSSQRNKVLYYDRRNPLHTQHERFMRKDIEQEILSKIQDGLQKYNRKEELVIYNGLVPDENDPKQQLRPMTVEEQFALFQDVTTIIGPHGSGLSGNLLWTNPMPHNCTDRVKVLEFIGEEETSSDTSPMGHGAYINHWEFVRGWPFDYHHILYEPESTQTGLVINLDRFEEALDSMWNSSSESSDANNDNVPLQNQ